MAVPQKAKFNFHSFQSSWRNEYGFFQHKHHALRTRCCQGFVFSTSSIQRYFQMKHEKHFKDEADKAKSTKRAIVRYRKQSSVFTNIDVNKKIKPQREVTKPHNVLHNMESHLQTKNISEAFLLFRCFVQWFHQ